MSETSEDLLQINIETNNGYSMEKITDPSRTINGSQEENHQFCYEEPLANVFSAYMKDRPCGGKKIEEGDGYFHSNQKL